MTRRQVMVDEPVSLSLGKYLDDSAGLTKALEAIDALARELRWIHRLAPDLARAL